MQSQDTTTKAGQRVALVIAGLGIFWLCANLAGSYFGWSNRTRALMDLATLAGFGAALWIVFKIWRQRQTDKG
ncbi:MULTISPECIES: DUF5337 domain-containing protein [Ascidiaceihabitans]|uniref:DUF5337 domain-containing protein n=1 Tax=Ascidiaceihabitans TaxID=1648492 RepID=UPI000D55340C|nr:DUF5337 domain-containing protein [Ascidiaceihabitans donghaensis]